MKNRGKNVRELDLEPIPYDEEMSAFNLRNEIDLCSTDVILEDYDWMNYKLLLRMPTKDYGDMKIEFAYFGAQDSSMKVETDEKTYEFSFSSDLFQEHIIKYLQKHIQHWEGDRAFSGMEEAIHFYNDVLTDPRTVLEKKRRKKGRD